MTKQEIRNRYMTKELLLCPVNFEYYKIFYYVAKYKSITQAASLLYSSQPSISRMIKILEQELGCTLFIRTRKGVALTPEGEELFDHVAPACEELFVGEELLSRSYGLQGDTIRIGASETALRCFLFDNLELFYAEHPAIKLKIYNHTASEALENLKNGNVDLAVVSTPLELVPPMRMTRLLPIPGNLHLRSPLSASSGPCHRAGRTGTLSPYHSRQRNPYAGFL